MSPGLRVNYPPKIVRCHHHHHRLSICGRTSNRIATAFFLASAPPNSLSSFSFSGQSKYFFLHIHSQVSISFEWLNYYMPLQRQSAGDSRNPYFSSSSSKTAFIYLGTLTCERMFLPAFKKCYEKWGRRERRGYKMNSRTFPYLKMWQQLWGSEWKKDYYFHRGKKLLTVERTLAPVLIIIIIIVVIIIMNNMARLLSLIPLPMNYFVSGKKVINFGNFKPRLSLSSQ